MTSLTHEFTETLPAPRERVFTALTNEDELTRWFAEHAEVDARAGGNFRFWGRHTYCAPARAEARQKIVRLETPSLLAFTWTIDGIESEVTLELTTDPADDSTTVLKGRHHFPEAPPVQRALDLVEDLWRMTCSNLRAHLSGGFGLCKPDFTDPLPRHRQTVLIDAPRHAIFQALLDPAILNKWIAANATVQLHVDGEYSYGWKYDVRGRSVSGGPTKILELVQNTKLVTDWPDWRGDPTRPPQRVTWLLEPIGDQTRVTLIHEPFERTTDLSDYPQGWTYFLTKLKTEVEATTPQSERLARTSEPHSGGDSVEEGLGGM